MSAPLAGRTAVVTGASSGIGRAIAEKLGAAGAHVFLAGRSSAPMEEAAKRIGEAGGKATVGGTRRRRAMTFSISRGSSKACSRGCI